MDPALILLVARILPTVIPVALMDPVLVAVATRLVIVAFVEYKLPEETKSLPKITLLLLLVSVTIKLPSDADTCVPSSNLIVECDK